MDRDSKERGGRGEAVKGLRRKGLDFFFKDERECHRGRCGWNLKPQALTLLGVMRSKKIRWVWGK